ncbi:hypothetical protein ABW19_dt0202512 [Dactylella cylindrospora]|nr:hypothetical protein ABW19_dt0202512 [Dactylella cylindrospora]
MGLLDAFKSSSKEKTPDLDDSKYSDNDSVLSEEFGVQDRKTYHIYSNMDWHNNRVVKDDDGNPLYFAEFHHTKRQKYITLHQGDKDGPALSNMRTNTLMTKFHLSHGGGPEQFFEADSYFKHIRYAWEIAGRRLLWKTTREGGLDGEGKKTKIRWNLKLVDEESNQVLAMFIAAKMAWKKEGKVVVKSRYSDQFGEDFEKGILMTALTIVDIMTLAACGAASSAAATSTVTATVAAV